MADRDEVVHVHKMDLRMTVEQYRKRGYILKEEGKATIAAQKGFIKLTFTPDSADARNEK